MAYRFTLAILMVLTLGGVCFSQTPASSPRKPRPQMTNAQLEQHLATIERKFWEGWAKGDVKPFQEYIAPDAIMVGENGTFDKQWILKAIAAGGCEVRSYDLTDLKLLKMSGDTAVLTYRGTQDATCGGEVAPKTVWISSVFVRRRGKWLAVAHQETAARQ
ncbi:MAG TPA: nuclear transport factor 2 family protein [Pyrinomonadaceae bacterium]|nr:nuclear transport factor 2 family protein [Pyrinomonadaceae bacterium]